MRIKLKETPFYFDKTAYENTMRVYAHILNCANEIAQEIYNVGITPNTMILQAFLSIKEIKVKAKSNVELVNENIGALPSFYTTELNINENAKIAIQTQFNANVNNVSQFIRKKVQTEQEQALKEVVNTCYNICHRYNTNLRGVTPFSVIDVSFFEWNENEGCAMLNNGKTQALKESFNVYPKNANVQKVFQTLQNVCAMLNEIAPLTKDSSFILSTIRQNVTGGFELLNNFDYNNL